MANRRCALCKKPETSARKLNKHHIRGKHYPNVMLVHTDSCHLFADWVTKLYLLAGQEVHLTEQKLIDAFHAARCMKGLDGLYVLPTSVL